MRNFSLLVGIATKDVFFLSYYAYSANNIFVKVVLGFFLA